jgi:glycosyltransferase involved in cell wall biosynthesis
VSADTTIDVSVIIPTYNRCQSLATALDSVAAVDFDRDAFEVVVVDNNSTDDTPQVAERFRQAGLQLVYVKEERLSFTVARHTGADTASGRVLSYIDDDCVVDPGWLRAVHETFAEDPKVGVVGGPILPRFEVEPPEWITRYHPMSGWLSLLDLGESKHQTKHAYGPNFSVRKDVLQEVGGFPADTIGVESEGRPGVVEKIYVGSGDIGLCAKVDRAGYAIMYAPAALVHHVIPPIRLTKKWWHSRLAGEGSYHALTHQYEHDEGRARILVRCVRSIGWAVKAWLKASACGVLGRGRERFEFFPSYHLTRARVEFALVRRPDLARRLWEIALSGVPPEDIDDLVRLLP